MTQLFIRDRFSADFDRIFGSTPTQFKLDGDREPPAHIPKWRINRTNARSVGRPTYMHTKPCAVCGGLERGTWTNKCKGCGA